MSRKHQYETTTVWNGDRGCVTADYRAYDRLYDTSSPDRPTIQGSSDPLFRGDKTRWNPELFLLRRLRPVPPALVLAPLRDRRRRRDGLHRHCGRVMLEDDDGGHFEEVVLRPVVTVADVSMVERAGHLHEEASKRCFIASSVNFPVRHEPQITVGEAAGADAV